ncbi:MAG: hypothetical protein LCH38_12635 [Proteobacteria bacterium]|nr:hypothetical protein [Pseudomonadota bacterium]
MRKWLVVLAFASFGILAQPNPVLASGCEGISNPFAYNECLARQSPQRGARRARAARAGDPEASVRVRRGRYAPAGGDHGSGVIISRGQGRTSAEIDPWAAIKRSFTPTPSRKRRR